MVRLIVFLCLCCPCFAQRFVCYAYDSSSGVILAAGECALTSQNSTGYTTTASVSMTWLPAPAPGDLTDQSARFRYRFNGIALVKLSASSLDGNGREALIDQYQSLLTQLCAVERALQIHTGNSKLVARRDALLSKEAAKWSEITAP